MRVGLNRAYDIREGRSSVALLTLEIASVIALGLSFVLVGYLLVLAPKAGSFLHRLMPGFEPDSFELGAIRYLVSGTILATVLFAAHVALPARRLNLLTCTLHMRQTAIGSRCSRWRPPPARPAASVAKRPDHARRDAAPLRTSPAS